MDRLQRNYILERETEIKKRTRLIHQLDMAEAINYAYLGSQPRQKNKTNRGARAYARWRRKKFNELYPKTKIYTVWDKLGRKSKKL